MSNESKILRRIQYLAHLLFVATPEGVEFMALMKDLDINTSVDVNNHGALAARQGARDLWRAINLHATNYQHIIASETHKEENLE